MTALPRPAAQHALAELLAARDLDGIGLAVLAELEVAAL